MNTTIKLIDVFGQFENQGTDHYYTYLPSGEAPTGWRNVMKDPRNEVAANLQQCYVTWCTATDWWIAKMVRNPHDSRSGFAMLSICLGPNRPSEGNKAATVLDNLAQFFIIEKHWVDADAEKALINQEQDLELVPCALRKFVEPTAALNSAYRSFETKEQLGYYLSFLPQPGYEEYSRIFFVPKGESEGMPVKCLDERLPLKRIYSLKYPDDKCVSSPMRHEIMEGEELIIRYNKQGLEPAERVIKGGANSECAFVDGFVMQIRPEHEVVGLVHDRVVTIKCQDENGRIIERFRLNNYTRQHDAVRINGDQVVMPENFSEFVVVEVIPGDDKYETKKVDLNPREKDNTKTVVLKPKDYKVVFRMGNEDFETNKTMNPSTARTRWSGFDSEVDNANKVIYFRTYGKPTEKHHDTTDEASLFERFPWLKYLIIGLVVLLLGYGIYAGISAWGLHKTPWPFNGKTEVKVENVNNGGDQVQEQPTQDELPPVDTVSEKVQHDIDYMKNNDVWKRDELQSVEFQSLYDAIASGNINEVVHESGSLFNERVVVNGYFSKIVDDIKMILEKDDRQKMKKASDEMKRICQGDGIVLGELLTSINRIVAEDTQSTTQQKKPEPSASNPQTNGSNNGQTQRETSD